MHGTVKYQAKDVEREVLDAEETILEFFSPNSDALEPQTLLLQARPELRLSLRLLFQGPQDGVFLCFEVTNLGSLDSLVLRQLRTQVG